MMSLATEAGRMVAAPFIRIAAWAHRHPRLASVLGSLLAVYALGWACVPAANAAGGGEPSPDARADHMLTSAGVRASHYGALFINRGDFFSGDKGMWAFLIDIVWGAYFWGVTTAIDTFTWLLQFQWVDVIAVPMRALSSAIGQMLSYFGIVPFALFLGGCLAALLLLRGKIGKAIVELSVSALIFAAIGGILASPINWLTEPGGALDSARDGGAQMSAALIKGEGDLHAVSSDANPVGDAVIGPLLDTFVVTPAEMASFGHLIEGDCGTVVDTAVMNLDPIKKDTNPVRDAVGTCDADAKAYADNTGINNLMQVVALGWGAWWIFLFAWVISLVLIVSILGTLYMAFTTTWRAPLALFPWADRSKLLMSVSLMFAGLFFVVVCQLLLAGSLWLMTSAMPLISKLGIPVAMQLNVLGYLGTATIITIVVVLINHHRTAKRLAEKLNNAIENAGTKRDLMPVMGLPTGLKRIAQQHLGNTGLRRQIDELDDAVGGDDNRSMNFLFFGQGPVTGGPSRQGPVHAGEFVATPSGPTSPAGGGLALEAAAQLAGESGSNAAGAAAKGASAIGTAVRYAGALKAGVGGVALEAAKDVASKAARRRIVVDSKGNGRVDRGSSSTSSSRPGITRDPGAAVERSGPRIVSRDAGPEHTTRRRIQIGPDGVGKVVHDTTTVAPKAPAATSTGTAIAPVKPRALRS